MVVHKREVSLEEKKMTEGIILLLHITCTILFGIRTIIGDTDSIRISSVICAIIWAMCVGIDIAKMIIG